MTKTNFFYWKIHKIAVNGDVTEFHLIDTIAKAIGIGQEFDVHRIRFRLANGQYFYRCGVKIMEGWVLVVDVVLYTFVSFLPFHSFIQL